MNVNNMSPLWAALRRDFAVPAAAFAATARAFQADVAAALAGDAGARALLPAYVANPGGGERGYCLALDMGGTNARALLVELLGGGTWRVRRQVACRLRDASRGYDYIAPATTPAALFDFLARLVGEVAPAGGTRLPLGFTFSYPCRQSGPAQAVLLQWNKEIEVPGVVGRDVGALLQAALDRAGVAARLRVIVNDTVATQLAGAYAAQDCRAGVIIGTGFNACYLEERSFPPPGRIINLEAGDFAGVAANRYDWQLDAASANPGGQRLEKMVAGRYVGELVRLAAADLARQGLIRHAAAWRQPYAITAADVGRILADTAPDLPGTAALLRRWGMADSTAAERAALRRLGALVAGRSARLVAAVLCGLVRCSDPALARRHVLAVDGALYRHLPGYAPRLSLLLRRATEESGGSVVLRLTPDGSGVGAAIAALLVE